MSATQPLTSEQASALAQRHGLTALAGRPPLAAYLRDLWQRRVFVLTLASGQAAARFQGNRFGRAWAALNPLLLIASYFFIFGLLLQTRRGVENFIGFLAIGVILFGVSAAVISSGSRAIRSNLGLVRALRFPRAVLPISVGLTELVANLGAFAVLIILMPLTGEPITWHWALLVPSVLMQVMAITGLSLLAARWVHAMPDLSNLVPLLLRLLRYTSGVFFSIAHFTTGMPAALVAILTYQPFAVHLATARQALMSEYSLSGATWAMSSVWAVGLFALGLWAFWGGEGGYGKG